MIGKRGISYSSVSTDEQADKGFSLPEQELRIRKFCSHQEIEIIESYTEDHSAKNFVRPEFQKLLAKIKSKSLRFDYLIVTKLDRFSRDIFNSISMYNTLNTFGIQVFSISEGIFDLSNVHTFFPNIIQATAAHYDNLLRSENTKRGLRQAQRQGHWISTAPKGYKSDYSTGRRLLLKDENGDLIEEGFKTFATGAYSIEEVRIKMMGKGLKCSKNGFNNILRNIAYIGLIKIPKWKDEPEEIVNSLHEPIIDKVTFEKVQDIIAGRYKKLGKKVKGEKYYLLGFLYCPLCSNKPMRASSPKGRNRKYDYYHCDTKNKCRCKNFPVDVVHRSVFNTLASFKIKTEVLHLYYQILTDVFKADEKEKETEITYIERELRRYESMSDEADDKYISGKLVDKVYNKSKERYGTSIYELKEKLQHLTMQDGNIKTYLGFGLSLLADLPKYFEEAGFYTKRKIIGSIFPDKLIFDGEKNRTTKTNQFIELIILKINDLTKNKKGQNSQKRVSPSMAPAAGLEPATL